MGHTVKIAALLLLLSLPTQAATTWYIDLNATGANNGTSWANAWTHLYSISNIAAGDTVEISQGVYNTANTADWIIPAGADTNHWTTVKHSRTAGHNGLVEIQCPTHKQHWTLLDGAVADNYETNILSTWDVAKITNNCGIYFNGPAANEDADGGACMHLSGADVQGNVTKWCIFQPMTHNPASQDRYGVRVDAAANLDGVEIGYCLFTNVYDFAVFANQNDHDGFGGWSIHHTVLQNAVPSGFCKNGELTSAGKGLDVYSCIINRFPIALCGEQDNFQINYWWRMWNNIIYPGGNSTMQSEITGGTNYGHCYFYGNLIIPCETNSPVSTAGSSLQINSLGYDSKANALAGYGGTNIYLSDWRFFNNTIICSADTGPSGFISCLAKDFAFGWGIYMVPETNGIVLYNNLLYTTNGQGFGLYPTYNGVGGDGGWKYNPTTVVVDYNVFGGINYASNDLMMTFGSASAFNSFSGFTHNTSTKPELKNVPAYDFRPTDSTAIGAGKNLASFATNMPGLMTDANGVARSSAGAWNIGALEPSGLVVWLLSSGSDTNWATTGIITNMAGMAGNNGYGVQMSATNWVTLTNGANGPFTNTYAAHWWPQYPFQQGAEQHNYGAYIAVTNLTDIQFLTNATICFWSHRDTNSYNATVAVGNMGTAQFGTLSNSWDIACDGENYRFRIGWPGLDDAGHITNLVYFPIQVPNQFYETNWTHYAVTINCPSNQVIGYYNGSPYATNNLCGVPYLRSDYSDQNTPWLGIGVNPHGGTPQMDYTGPGTDQFPNNGWLGGDLADIRIYNRALSAAEISVIASGATSGGSSPAAPFSSGGTATATTVRAANTFVGH